MLLAALRATPLLYSSDADDAEWVPGGAAPDANGKCKAGGTAAAGPGAQFYAGLAYQLNHPQPGALVEPSLATRRVASAPDAQRERRVLCRRRRRRRHAAARRRWHSMLRCAMLCHAMPCHAMPAGAAATPARCRQEAYSIVLGAPLAKRQLVYAKLQARLQARLRQIERGRPATASHAAGGGTSGAAAGSEACCCWGEF